MTPERARQLLAQIRVIYNQHKTIYNDWDNRGESNFPDLQRVGIYNPREQFQTEWLWGSVSPFVIRQIAEDYQLRQATQLISKLQIIENTTILDQDLEAVAMAYPDPNSHPEPPFQIAHYYSFMNYGTSPISMTSDNLALYFFGQLLMVTLDNATGDASGQPLNENVAPERRGLFESLFTPDNNPNSPPSIPQTIITILKWGAAGIAGYFAVKLLTRNRR